MHRFTVLFVSVLSWISCSAPRASSHRVSVHGEDMLVGAIQQEELFRTFEVFREQYEAYMPDDSVVHMIAAVRRDIRVEAFLGTWCGESRVHLSHFLKVMARAGNSRISYSLHGLDRTKKDPEGLTVTFHITRVPTLVFLEGGRELGRITEYPEARMEDDVYTIIKD